MLVVVVLPLLWVSGGSSTDLKTTPGQDVTLTCEDAQINKITLLLWSREDPEKKNLFVLRDGRPFPSVQHESFKNRVSLKDPQMKNGDLSVVLENVTMNDTGIYQCKVRHKNDPDGSSLNPISTINLQVSPPGEEDEDDDGGEDTDGAGRGLLGLIALPVLVVVLVVVLWIYRKKSRGFPAESSDKQMSDL